MEAAVPPEVGSPGALRSRGPRSVGAKLRVLREQAGLSQETLAERAGVGVATLAAIERGQRQRPHPHTLTALADALSLGPAERAALLGSVARVSDRAGSVAAGPDTTSSRLPSPPAPLIGRDAEVRQACDLLDPSGSNVRLLVLVGPCGVGKTRLALEVAHRLRPRFADGVYWVPRGRSRR